MRQAEPYDLVVAGGGPAGLATAIHAAKQGLRVALIERGRPSLRPGESLHPGVAPVLAGLGVDIDALGFVRFNGVLDLHHGREIPFGSGAQGPWLGYQALPEVLDAALSGVAQATGVFWIRARVRDVQHDQGAWNVQLNNREALVGRWLVDATGARGIGQRAWTRVSPVLFASWVMRPAGPDDPLSIPTFRGTSHGWTYRAQISPSTISEVHVSLTGARVARPTSVSCFYRGFDVTWRHRFDACEPNCVKVGDAQFVIDPASGKGVLRGLMSGIMAAHCIAGVVDGKLSALEAREHYRQWSRGWFETECRELANLYANAPFDQAWARPFVDQVAERNPPSLSSSRWK